MFASKDKALAFYKDGDYEKALPLLMELYDANAKNKRDASINQWIGVCLYNLSNNTKDAVPYLKYASSKNIQESYIYLAKLAFLDYNFKDVDVLLAEYDAFVAKTKNGKESNLAKEFKIEYNKVKIMLSYVEQVAVIDSLVVDKDDFFKAYKIVAECGSLNSAEILPNGYGDSSTSVVFANESKSRLIWGEQNDNGMVRIYETTKLIGDKWSDKVIIGDNMAESDADINFPYLMPDGSTIYFATNGQGSIGGYDIFVSMKDIDSGSYYQPQNMGMPYNSIYDDYMMVVDEFTGVGWWATDRNKLGDKLTIYIFTPNAVRQNYNPDRDDIAMLAKVNAIKDTWVNGTDYSSVLKNIEDIKPAEVKVEVDFYLPISRGVMYNWFTDFKSAEAKNIAYGWVELTKKFEAEELALKALRATYANASDTEKINMSNEIIAKEREIERLRVDIRNKVNAIIRAEK
ncbi:MAG: hypothetical protein R3Y22_02510 [Bacteroidales bacterium]